jgi:hypothetical protein
MSFLHLNLTEDEFMYEAGFKNGLTLKERQAKFLKETTLKKIMTSKKKQK